MNLIIAGRKVEWDKSHISYGDVVNRWVLQGDMSERVSYMNYLAITGESPSTGSFMFLPADEPVLVEEGLSFTVDVAHAIQIS